MECLCESEWPDFQEMPKETNISETTWATGEQQVQEQEESLSSRLVDVTIGRDKMEIESKSETSHVSTPVRRKSEGNAIAYAARKSETSPHASTPVAKRVEGKGKEMPLIMQGANIWISMITLLMTRMINHKSIFVASIGLSRAAKS